MLLIRATQHPLIFRDVSRIIHAMMTAQKRIEDGFGRIVLSPCQFPQDINDTAGRAFRILWMGARATGADFDTRDRNRNTNDCGLLDRARI